jgi:DNA repair protein RecN (Recombination protein N)
VSADGRSSKARINGRLVTAAILAEFGSRVMEIAGQHEHHRLGRPGFQRALLDAYAGTDAIALAEEVTRSVHRAAEARRRLEELRSNARSRSREADVLTYEIKEIDSVAPVAGETDELHSIAQRLEHSEEIATGVATAVAALREEGGAEETVGVAESSIRKLEGTDSTVVKFVKRLEAARYEIADVAEELSALLEPPDPDALEAARSRLASLARLKRKYGAGEEEVLEYLEGARRKLAELEGSEEDEERLEREHERLVAEARDAALRLSALRAEAAPRLAAEVEEWLRRLALPDARFEVAVEERPLYEGGLDETSFLVAPNQGEAATPVVKTASGGELSRIALALSLVSTTGSIRTMIFDEVDSGVGGEAARAVGRALAQLAEVRGIQVIVVTHLPQVAAFAEHQYLISKHTERGRTIALVARVEGDERIAELSRMLAGMPDSDASRRHAEELLRVAADEAAGQTRVS